MSMAKWKQHTSDTVQRAELEKKLHEICIRDRNLKYNKKEQKSRVISVLFQIAKDSIVILMHLEQNYCGEK